MGVTLQTKNLSETIKDMEGYIEDLNAGIGVVMTNTGAKVEEYAKSNHRFTSRSGNLENSVTFEYSLKPNGVHVGEIFLDDRFTAVPDGRSYGVFIHEGTYQGYSQSSIAPRYSSSTSLSGNGWRADPFLEDAIARKWKPEREIRKLEKKLQHKYQRV